MNKRGSILAAVVVIAAVLFLLTGVAYTYFKMNAGTVLYRIKRTRAETTAEAGIALAIHFLSAMDQLPHSTEPFLMEMEGDSSGWTSIPGGGRCLVIIDPVNGFSGENVNGAVEIRSRGISGDITREIYARVSPSYPSSYALLTSEGIPEGFFSDNRVVNGRVHSNGIITFSSYSPDSMNDPYVEMISTTSQGGFYFTSGGRSEVPHPQGSNTWVRPYSRLSQGSPFWQFAAPLIDFQRMSSSFRSFTSSMASEGTVEITAERVLIDGQQIFFKNGELEPERSMSLSDIDLVVIRNSFSPVTIKTVSRPDHPITVLALGDINIGGTIDGGTAGAGGPMGLVSCGDIVISADPDLIGTSDWAGKWQIETDAGLMIRACLVIPSGTFRAQTPYLPQDITRVTVNGSLTQSEMGRLSSANSGYELGVSWDQGLGAVHPPHFPMLGRWNVYSWLVDPADLGDSDIEDDLV